MDKIGERIKEIRLGLGMSQKSFAEQMGLSRDVIGNIEYGRVPDVKDYVIKAICREYKVNYFWLTEGKGDPYLSAPDIIMDDVIREYGLDETDRLIIEEYVKLPPATREAIKQLIKNIIKKAPE